MICRNVNLRDRSLCRHFFCSILAFCFVKAEDKLWIMSVYFWIFACAKNIKCEKRELKTSGPRSILYTNSVEGFYEFDAFQNIPQKLNPQKNTVLRSMTSTLDKVWLNSWTHHRFKTKTSSIASTLSNQMSSAFKISIFFPATTPSDLPLPLALLLIPTYLN